MISISFTKLVTILTTYFCVLYVIKGEDGIKAVGYFNNDWSLGKDFYIKK
jgi:hypothetical protein